MFAHVLSVLVAASSFLFYMAAFFYPEVHRPLDWVWSGLGLFYAVVLWYCAGQMTAVVVLAQMSAIALLLVLGWQLLSIRREKTPVYQQTPVVLTPEVVGEWAKGKLNQLRIAPDETLRSLPPQNRSLNATAAERFRQVPDPRRRPVYDYEFVEDGLVEDSPVKNILVENGLIVETDVAEDVAVVAEETSEDALVADYSAIGLSLNDLTEAEADVDEADVDIGSVPPSVDAEVISETVPEVVKAEPESVRAEPESVKTDLEVIQSEAEVAEPEAEVIEPEFQVTPEPVKSGHDQDAQTISKQADSLQSVSSSASGEDWGFDDEFLDDPKLDDPKTESLPPKEKPSLLAMPIILAGWIKDVVTSVTRPKPSKPVIDIPRREPSASMANAGDVADAPDIGFADTSAEAGNSGQFDDDNTDQFDDDNTDQFDDDNTDQFDDDSNWEERNWDD
ncbi:MAG: Ycf66 family protein [Cyanobacteria bacterium J06631_9]